jgi:hypothetical protein
MSGTARLAMPFLSVGQAQKELVHNEALQILDALVAAAVEGPPQASAPASPVVGACYLVAADATGDWATKPQCVACYTGGGWRFIEPAEGMIAYIRSDGVWATYRAGAWETGAVRGSNLILDGQQVVGGRAAAIASPSGGTTIDSEARSTIDQLLAAMRQHGLIET